jgi:hypothetical protein
MTLARVYGAAQPKPFSLIGFIDDDRRKLHKLFEGFAVVGTSRNLLTIMTNIVIRRSGGDTGEVQGGTPRC